MNISFFIDSTKPQISSTTPLSNSYTNGSNFLVKYNEINLNTTQLVINNIIINQSCPSGNKQCLFSINLSNFNNQNLYYYFVLTDIAGNAFASRPISIFVDTIPPVINNPDSFYIQDPKNKHYINFNISVNATYFNSVKYIDNNNFLLKFFNIWSTLCSNLNKGYCINRVYFNTGMHNLTIQISDKAGNSMQKNINFSV